MIRFTNDQYYEVGTLDKDEKGNHSMKFAVADIYIHPDNVVAATICRQPDGTTNIIIETSDKVARIINGTRENINAFDRLIKKLN